MKSFNQFLAEQADAPAKLKHIEHLEDHHINDGEAGFKHAVDVLNKTRNHIESGKSNSDVTVKYDGSPSVVYGHHPETGKFFVATKSAFNKDPKLNYTHEDIERNHGHAPGLVSKLKSALDHLPKVAPKEGVFQGDLMHTPEDHVKKGDAVSFKPNTITYTARSDEAAKVKKSKVGIVTHTEYKGKDLESMSAEPIKSGEHFNSHPDVHHFSPAYHGVKQKLTPENDALYKKHVQAANDSHVKTNYEPIKDHAEHIKTYINSTIRNNTEASHEGLVNHIKAKHIKAIEGVKTDKAKAAKTEKMNADLEHLSTHKEHFQNTLNTYKHLQAAKNILVHHMNNNYSGFEHHVNGEASNPEGYVTSHKGDLTKLVDRRAFSAANFAPRT
jgi:hypothetical protein